MSGNLSETLGFDFLLNLLKALLNFLPRRASASENSPTGSASDSSSSISALVRNAILLVFFSGLSFKVISKVCKDPINSSTCSSVMSCASSMAVTFIANLLGRDLRIFFTSFSFDIFSPRAKEVLAISLICIWNSAIVCSSDILRFSNWVVSICSLDILTLEVPSCAVFRISQASLAIVQVLISLNMFLSAPLKMALRAFEFAKAASSSSGGQTPSSFNSDVVVDEEMSSAVFVFTGGVQPLTINFHVLLSIDLRKAVILAFQ